MTPSATMSLIRERVGQTNPSIPLFQIAAEGGMSEAELVRFIMDYHEPRKPRAVANSGYVPRDPELRAHLNRLRDREATLLTVVTEAPRQLETVQHRIASLERTR